MGQAARVSYLAMQVYEQSRGGPFEREEEEKHQDGSGGRRLPRQIFGKVSSVNRRPH